MIDVSPVQVIGAGEVVEFVPEHAVVAIGEEVNQHMDYSEEGQWNNRKRHILVL
jgi:hypothetical protein